MTRIDWESTPLFREFGVRVAERAPGFARLAVRHESVKMRGIRDGLNGGVLAALIEAAARVCLDGDGGTPGSARELTVNYLSAVRGAVTHFDARVARKGRRLAVGSVEVRDAESGLLCATALVTCAIVQPAG